MGFVEEDVFGGFGEVEEFVFGLMVVGLIEIFAIDFFKIEVDFCRCFCKVAMSGSQSVLVASQKSEAAPVVPLAASRTQGVCIHS